MQIYENRKKKITIYNHKRLYVYYMLYKTPLCFGFKLLQHYSIEHFRMLHNRITCSVDDF
jgi:hypothetical protein